MQPIAAHQLKFLLFADYALASSYVGAFSAGREYSNRLISPVEYLDGVHCVRTTLMQTTELRVTVYVGNTTRLAYVGIDQLGPAWHWLMFDIETGGGGEAVPVQIVFDSRLPTDDVIYGAMLNDVVLTKGRCQDRCKNRFLGAVALTVGPVLRVTILNYVICIGHYRVQPIQQPIKLM